MLETPAKRVHDMDDRELEAAVATRHVARQEAVLRLAQTERAYSEARPEPERRDWACYEMIDDEDDLPRTRSSGGCGLAPLGDAVRHAVTRHTTQM